MVCLALMITELVGGTGRGDFPRLANQPQTRDQGTKRLSRFGVLVVNHNSVSRFLWRDAIKIKLHPIRLIARCATMKQGAELEKLIFNSV